MSDKLKQFVKEHRDQMDVHEPSADMWNSLNKQLGKKSFLNKLLQNNAGKLLLAGSAIVATVAVYTFTAHKNDQDNRIVNNTTSADKNISENAGSRVAADDQNNTGDQTKANETINNTELSNAKPESTVTDVKRNTVIIYYNVDRLSGGSVSNNFYNGAKTRGDQPAASINTGGPTQLVASAAVTNIKCKGDRSGQIDITPVGNRESYTYMWSAGNKTTEDICGLSAGTYTLSVTDSRGGVGTYTYTITEPAAMALSVTADHARCGSNNGTAAVTVNTGGPGPYNYLWNNGAATASINNLSSGSYNVTVTDNNGCRGVANVIIGNIAGVTSAFTVTRQADGDPFKVNFVNSSSGANTWTWKFGDGETDAGRNASHTYAREGTHHACLIAQNTSGCRDSSCSNIMVNSSVSFTVPNVFTPNGDGKNDVFIIATKEINKVEVNIYDELGAKVWEYSGPSAMLDGNTGSGKPAIDGNYIYVFKAYSANDKVYEQKGIVKLAR